MEFNENSTLEQVMELPASQEVLQKYGVPCLTCPMAKFEMAELTIRQICATYGIQEKELLADLNAAAKTYFAARTKI